MAKSGFDFEGMDILLDQVKHIQKNHEKFIRSFLLEMGNRALAETKRRTPVDTGELRRNWQLSDVYRKDGDTLYVVLWNKTDYASHVEYGHRTVRGDGFVEGYHMAEVSIDKINREIPARYNRAFQQFMAGF